MKRLLVFVGRWRRAAAGARGPGAATPQASPESRQGARRSRRATTADKREAAIAVLGETRRSEDGWRSSRALRDGSVYVRAASGKDAEIVVGGAKITEGDADARSPIVHRLRARAPGADGAAGRSCAREVAADRRLRIAIKPFLDADETRAAAREPRSRGAPRRGHEARPPGGRPARRRWSRRRSRRRPMRWVRHALEEALALIRLANGDAAAASLAAAVARGARTRRTRLPALQKLAADAGASPARAGRRARRHPPDRALGPAGRGPSRPCSRASRWPRSCC